MKRHLCLQSVFFALAIAIGGQARFANAQDGEPIIETWEGGYSDVKVQWWDQKIVVVGGWSDPNGLLPDRISIARYDADGVPDITFGDGGVSTPDLGASDKSAQGLALQTDGKAVVSGFSGTNIVVARFNADGTIDGGFGSGGSRSLNVGATFLQSANGVGLQSTGKVVVSGTSLGMHYPSDAGVAARFTASGALDSGKGAFGQVVNGKAIGYATFGYPNAGFTRLAVQPDNKLVAVGDWIGSGLLVARFTANGVLDKTFNGKGYALSLPAGTSASNVLLQADGKIVVVGFGPGVEDNTDMLIARFTSSGALDGTFGEGSGYVRLDVDDAMRPTREYAFGIALQPDGKIVASGRVMYDDVPGTGVNVFVTRVNSDGTLDLTFGIAGFKTAGAAGIQSLGGPVALQADGSMIVAGSVLVDEGGIDVTHPMLMRFDP